MKLYETHAGQLSVQASREALAGSGCDVVGCPQRAFALYLFVGFFDGGRLRLVLEGFLFGEDFIARGDESCDRLVVDGLHFGAGLFNRRIDDGLQFGIEGHFVLLQNQNGRAQEVLGHSV